MTLRREDLHDVSLDFCAVGTALVEAVDQRRVLYVNTHPGMDGRKKEEERLRGLSYVTVNTYLDLDYEGLLRELDATCNDGIADALQ